jgi:cytochrome c oxidase cbb3-type subunit 4
MSTIFSLWTVIVFILFIGIVVWAWSGKRKQEFDEAAMIPFNDEDDETEINNQEAENRNA